MKKYEEPPPPDDKDKPPEKKPVDGKQRSTGEDPDKTPWEH